MLPTVLPFLLPPLLGAASEPLLNRLEERLAAARGLEVRPRTALIRALSALGCAGLFLTVFLTADGPGQLAFRLVALSVCWVATLFDLRYRVIPNELILALLATAAVSSLLGFTGADILSSLAGFLVCGVLFVVPFLLGKKVGGGDVKLAAAIGLCAGLQSALLCIVIMGMLILLYTFVQRSTFLAFLHQFIPMGPFVTAAYFLLLIR